MQLAWDNFPCNFNSYPWDEHYWQIMVLPARLVGCLFSRGHWPCSAHRPYFSPTRGSVKNCSIPYLLSNFWQFSPFVSLIFWSSSLQVGSRSWLTGLGRSLSARVWWKCSGWWKWIGSFSQKDPVCKFKITARPTSTKALTHMQVLERLSSPLLGPFYPTLLSVLTDKYRQKWNININYVHTHIYGYFFCFDRWRFAFWTLANSLCEIISSVTTTNCAIPLHRSIPELHGQGKSEMFL